MCPEAGWLDHVGNPTWVPPIVHDHRTLSQERTSFPFCRCLDLLKSVNTPFGKNLKSRHVRNSRVRYPTLITASASSSPPLNASAALRASAAGPIGPALGCPCRRGRGCSGRARASGQVARRPPPGRAAGGRGEAVESPVFSGPYGPLLQSLLQTSFQNTPGKVSGRA